MTARPRLLVLTSTFPRWQNDHEPPFVFELAHRLTERFDVTVLAPHVAGAARKERMNGTNVRRFRYAPARLEQLAYDGGIPTKLRLRPWLILLVPLFLVAQTIAAVRIIRQQRPVAVHAHWIIPCGIIGALSKWFAAEPFHLVITAHGADVHAFNRRPVISLKRWALRSADVVATVSRAMRDRIATITPAADRLVVAPMGVDLQSRFFPPAAPASRCRLLFAGRLVEKKGLTDLLDAVALLRPTFPDLDLVIIGDGPLAQALKEKTERLQLNDTVRFLGSVPNDAVPDIMRTSQLAVFPFKTARGGDEEGLGLVVVEAMGCGVPVVVGAVPAVLDVVEHERNGLLVPSDDPTALAQAIMRLLTDRQFAERLSTQARQDVIGRFDWQSVADTYARLLTPQY